APDSGAHAGIDGTPGTGGAGGDDAQASAGGGGGGGLYGGGGGGGGHFGGGGGGGGASYSAGKSTSFSTDRTDTPEVVIAYSLTGSLQSMICTTSGDTVTCTFTGAGEQTFTVPQAVTSLRVTAVGGVGGSADVAGAGGNGATVSTTL